MMSFLRTKRAAADQSRSPSVLPIKGEALTYRSGDRLLLDHVDVELGSGSGITVVIGQNGAGKSLLLRTLAGLIRPTEGRVSWGGESTGRDRIRDIGFVLQRPVLLRRSALANVEFALAVAGRDRLERRERARAALEAAHLSHVANSPAQALSGGEQQRLALARALVLDPQCLLLDEPTANLDPLSTEAFERQLKAQRDAGTPVLLVTQDVGQVRRLADRIIFLHRGRVLEEVDAQRFFEAPRTGQVEAFFGSRLAT